MSFTHF